MGWAECSDWWITVWLRYCAGGCETGWMYRAVEGQVHYWWVGFGNIIGATVLAYYWDDLGPWLATDFDKVNLLETFGPEGGLLVTYGLLAAAFVLMLVWEKHFSVNVLKKHLMYPWR